MRAIYFRQTTLSTVISFFSLAHNTLWQSSQIICKAIISIRVQLHQNPFFRALGGTRRKVNTASRFPGADWGLRQTVLKWQLLISACFTVCHSWVSNFDKSHCLCPFHATDDCFPKTWTNFLQSWQTCNILWVFHHCRLDCNKGFFLIAFWDKAAAITRRKRGSTAAKISLSLNVDTPQQNTGLDLTCPCSV